MDPATILSIVSFAISEEPAVASLIAELFHGTPPTSADWEAVRAKIASESYAALVPNSKIPPGQ